MGGETVSILFARGSSGSGGSGGCSMLALLACFIHVVSFSSSSFSLCVRCCSFVRIGGEGGLAAAIP